MEELIEKVAPAFPDKAFFVGVVNPKLMPESYDGLYMKESEEQILHDDLKNGPLWHEHKGKKTFGETLTSRKNDKGEIETLGYVDTKSIKGCSVIELMRSGNLKGLSLGTTYKIKDHGDKLEIIQKKTHETSVVEDPAFEDCKFIYVQPLSQEKKQIKEFLHNISEITKLQKQLHIGFFLFSIFINKRIFLIFYHLKTNSKKKAINS